MKTLFLIPCILFSFTSFAQNLVPNPSFENTDVNFCGIMSNTDFNSTNTDWITPGYGSPDLYYTSINDSCFNFQPNSNYPGPIGIKGSQLPRTGQMMAGFGTYSIQGMEQREYVQVPLSSPLVVGDIYLVECYVSLADSVEFASDQLGMLLSSQVVTQPNNLVINSSPQIQFNGMITDVQNWVLITDTIVATEAFQYLTIGNFNSDANTNLQANPTYSSKPGTYGAYYFIDDVSVTHMRSVNTVNYTINKDKKRVKVIDLMGRETKVKPGIPLIYIYDDGSREKVIVR